jgi:hypothetical protein
MQINNPPSVQSVTGAEATANKGIANGYTGLNARVRVNAGQVAGTSLDESLRQPLFDAPPICVLATGETSETWEVSPAGSVSSGIHKIGSTGRQTTAVSADGNPSSNAYIVATLDYPHAVSGNIGTWVEIDHPENIYLLEVVMYPVGGAIDNNRWYQYAYANGTDNYRGLPTADGYWLYTNGCRSWSASGQSAFVPNSTVIGKVGIRFKSRAGTSVTVTHCGVYEERFPKGAVVLGFDGMYDTNWPYYQIMIANDIRGVHYVGPGSVGVSGRLSLAQAQACYAAGWEIEPHCTGETGEYLTAIGDGDRKTEDYAKDLLWRSRNGLAAMGFFRGNNINSYYQNAGRVAAGPPENIKSILAGCGFTASRWCSSDQNHYDIQPAGIGYGPSTAPNGPWILGDWYNMPAGSIPNQTLEQAEANLDLIEAGCGVWSFFAHEIKTGDWEPDVAYPFLERIIADRNADILEVITPSEWLARTRMRTGMWRIGDDGTLLRWTDAGWVSGY